MSRKVTIKLKETVTLHDYVIPFWNGSNPSLTAIANPNPSVSQYQ